MKELQVTTKLNKKTIAQCLLRIQVDHSINIDIKSFDAKVDLLFDDCKDFTNEQFISISETLRRKELYGKLPTSGAFLSFFDRTKTLLQDLNRIAGDKLMIKINKNNDVAEIYFENGEAFKKYQLLPDDIKNEIKSKITTDTGAIKLEPKF